MVFPLYYIVFIYLLFLIIYAIFLIVNLYHLIAFSEASFAGFGMTFLLLAGIAYILYWTWQMSLPIDWNYPIELFQNLGSFFRP